MNTNINYSVISLGIYILYTLIYLFVNHKTHTLDGNSEKYNIKRFLLFGIQYILFGVSLYLTRNYELTFPWIILLFAFHAINILYPLMRMKFVEYTSGELAWDLLIAEISFLFLLLDIGVNVFTLISPQSKGSMCFQAGNWHFSIVDAIIVFSFCYLCFFDAVVVR